MRLTGDARPFWDAVREVRTLLTRLNNNGSFDGFITLFSRLVEELPTDFIEPQLVPAIPTNDKDATLVIYPGPDLEAIRAALRALDLVNHQRAPSSNAKSALPSA